MIRRQLWLAALLVVTSACANSSFYRSATIYRRNAPDLEAPIIGGNSRYLYVETDDGRVVRIERDKVLAIDHPGNGEAAVGAVATGSLGLMLLAILAWSGALNNNSDESGQILLFSAATLAVPVGLTVHGLSIWNGSVEAAADMKSEFPVRWPERYRQSLPAVAEPVPLAAPGTATGDAP